jgi:hypothetical protein
MSYTPELPGRDESLWIATSPATHGPMAARPGRRRGDRRGIVRATFDAMWTAAGVLVIVGLVGMVVGAVRRDA